MRVVVVDHPVAQLAEPVVAALDAERLPVGLVGAHAGDGRGDLVGRVDGTCAISLAGRRVEDLDWLGRGGGPAPFSTASVFCSTVPLSTGAPFVDPFGCVAKL